MAVRPQANLRSNVKKEEAPQWEPHYKARFSQYTIDRLVDERFAFVDSRKIRELILNNQMVLELWDNPMNDGRGVLVTPQGFRVLADPSEKDPSLEKVGDFLVWPLGRGFKVWSANVPVVGKLAFTFRSVRKVGPDGQAFFQMTNF
jgi:hypothetical protein